MSSFPQDIRDAHHHCSHNRLEILASSTCGCFYCLSIFPPDTITLWTDWPNGDEDEPGQTALCPECGIDSVIGDRSEFPITRDFLERMKQFWF